MTKHSPEEAQRILREQMADARGRMHGAVDALDHDLQGYRTGRASTTIVDRLQVPYYGTPTPLNQMATLATPEPRLITIQVWDPNSVAAVEKAILASDIGLTPSTDGQLIRLPVPTLTEERREELNRLVSKRVEEARIAIRNVRRDLLQHIDQIELPEDNEHTAHDEAQEITDEYIKQAESHGEAKMSEISEV